MMSPLILADHVNLSHSLGYRLESEIMNFTWLPSEEGRMADNSYGPKDRLGEMEDSW